MQKDRKTKTQKYRKTERQKDRKTERQKDRKTERQKDRKTERQKDSLKVHGRGLVSGKLHFPVCFWSESTYLHDLNYAAVL